MTRREEYAAATRQALIDAGVALFVAEGYEATGIEAIARAARVTRGAFYHHFADKPAIFDAIVVALQQHAVDRIQANAIVEVDLWDRLRVGIDTYLDVCLEPAYARLVIHEAPAVLGMARSREIEESLPLALLVATLSALRQRGELEPVDIDLLARMLDAMICKLAIMLADATEHRDLRLHGHAMIDVLLDAHRTH